MNTKKLFIYSMLLLASLLLVVSTSCEKEDDDPTPPVENENDNDDDNGNENGNDNGEENGDDNGNGDFECGEPFTDTRDGNIYQTVLIGEQCWMAQNLAYLPEITFKDNWGSLTEPQYAVYGYEPSSGTETVAGAKDSEHYDNYGVLYNWLAALTVCPSGWHLPSDDEWTELVDYVVSQGYPNVEGNPNGACNALKSCRQINSPLGAGCDTSEHPRWDSQETHFGFDEFGFSALPGGNRGLIGTFVGIGNNGDWWSATEFNSDNAWFIDLYYDNGSVFRLNFSKRLGLSVRCVRDN